MDDDVDLNQFRPQTLKRASPIESSFIKNGLL